MWRQNDSHFFFFGARDFGAGISFHLVGFDGRYTKARTRDSRPDEGSKRKIISSPDTFPERAWLRTEDKHNQPSVNEYLLLGRILFEV